MFGSQFLYPSYIQFTISGIKTTRIPALKSQRWARRVSWNVSLWHPRYYWVIIRRLVKRCQADVVFLASVLPVPASSQSKKQTHSLQCVLLGDEFGDFSTCEVGVTCLIPGMIIAKGCTHNSDKRTHLRDFSQRPSWGCSQLRLFFSMYTVTKKKHT